LFKFPHPHFHLHHHNLTNLSSSAPPAPNERVMDSAKSSRTKPSSSSSRRTEDSHLVNERSHKSSKSSKQIHQPHHVDKHGKPGRKSSGATTSTATEPHHDQSKKHTKPGLFTKKSKAEGGHYYNSNHPLHPMSHAPSSSSQKAGGAHSRSTSAQHHQSRIKSTDSGDSKSSSNRSKSFEQSSSGSGSGNHLVNDKHSKVTKHHTKGKTSKSGDKNTASDFVHVQMVNPVPSGSNSKHDKSTKNSKSSKKRPSTESSSIEA
jgi:hypothetical protein